MHTSGSRAFGGTHAVVGHASPRLSRCVRCPPTRSCVEVVAEQCARSARMSMAGRGRRARAGSAFPVLKRDAPSAIIPAHVLPPGLAPEEPEPTSLRPTRPPYLALLLVGLGGLFAGVTGPLLSTFVPLLVSDAIGERRSLIGAVMAIDNVLLLLLVPLAGAASDRARAAGGRRLPLVLGGFALAAAGMAVLPGFAALGIGGLLAAMLLLYTGINLQRSPFQALVADLVPSRYRTLGTASVTFQMCVGAIVFLMLGRALGMRIAFLVAAGTVLAIAALFAVGLREEPASTAHPAQTGFRSLGRDGLGGRTGSDPWHPGGVRRHAAPATHLPDVLDVVRAARHGAVRRAAGGHRDRVHRVGHRRGPGRDSCRRHRRARSDGATRCCSASRS